MAVVELDAFLSKVGRPTLVAYFGTHGATPLQGLEERLEWAERWRRHPDVQEEAEFLLTHQEALREELGLVQVDAGVQVSRSGTIELRITDDIPRGDEDTVEVECPDADEELEQPPAPDVAAAMASLRELHRRRAQRAELAGLETEVAPVPVDGPNRPQAEPAVPSPAAPVARPRPPVSRLFLLAVATAAFLLGLLMPRPWAESPARAVADTATVPATVPAGPPRAAIARD